MFPPARRRFSRTKPLRMTFPPVEGGGRKSLSVGARSKDTPRTGTKNFRVYCRLARVPQIHFGRSDGVECTRLRVACQSETFLAPLWQGGIDIRVLWHIGCQSDFDELVSMSSRPVDRGSGRMGSISKTFHPVKGGFGRMGMHI